MVSSNRAWRRGRQPRSQLNDAGMRLVRTQHSRDLQCLHTAICPHHRLGVRIHRHIRQLVLQVRQGHTCAVSMHCSDEREKWADSELQAPLLVLQPTLPHPNTVAHTSRLKPKPSPVALTFGMPVRASGCSSSHSLLPGGARACASSSSGPATEPRGSSTASAPVASLCRSSLCCRKNSALQGMKWSSGCRKKVGQWRATTPASQPRSTSMASPPPPPPPPRVRLLLLGFEGLCCLVCLLLLLLLLLLLGGCALLCLLLCLWWCDRCTSCRLAAAAAGGPAAALAAEQALQPAGDLGLVGTLRYGV